MASLFLAEGKRKGPALSFLFYEILEALYAADPEINMGDLVATALHQSDTVRLEAITPGICMAVCERIRAAKETEEVEPKGKPAVGKGMGVKFAKSFDALPSDEKCLFAADYDYQYARQLYTELDRDAAANVIRAKFNHVLELQMIQFEGVVYGNGGTFEGGDSDADTTTIDGESLSESESLESATAFMGMMGRRG